MSKIRPCLAFESVESSHDWSHGIIASQRGAYTTGNELCRPDPAAGHYSVMRKKQRISDGESFTEHHKNGTVCATGRKLDGQLHGYWEWFRKDGTLKRSGSFDRGVQTGEWTTYDAKGKTYKVTIMKSSKKSVSPLGPSKKSAAKPKSKTAKPKLLAGGNPQITKADGDAPVQTFIAAMPGWKQEVGRTLDALISRTVPNVLKAVRWNTPFYGVEDKGWFLGFHCITKYVKVAFFRGALLTPVPPGESKQKDVRYFHIYEGDEIDEKLLTSWIKQASKVPGEMMF